MTLSGALIAVLIILVYLILSFYIGYNWWKWLQSTRLRGKYKKSFIFLMTVLILSVFLGQIIIWPVFKWIGGYWMAIFGYSLILLPLLNLIRFLLKRMAVFWLGMGYMAFLVIIFIVGTFNAWNPVVRHYDVTIPKQSDVSNIKILMASDLHLGSIVGNSHLQKLVDISDEVQPDIILLAGDIIDDQIEPFLKQNMSETIGKLNAPLGVYAVSGNHDVYGNDLSHLDLELERKGIKFLQDETVLINDAFYLTGRRDQAEEKRMEVYQLTRGLDRSKPIMMLDHQPTELNEAEKAGIDLLVSGHTHHGQLAPANLITGMLFENDGGYLQKNTLHSFVSSGFGTWGPPLRIGSRSEVMVINLMIGES